VCKIYYSYIQPLTDELEKNSKLELNPCLKAGGEGEQQEVRGA
jgi:hypothetical protein